MLHLKRASAGSGKTYQLAKYYIRYIISIREKETGVERLRTFPELNDGLGRILAVTFTNKATEEMKTRIVDRLYALAHYDGTGKKPDYLEDFANEFHTTETEVSRVAREALRVLLKDFSNFNVSTIDSFFQRVLRTFAYEADFSDNYQVELDSAYVSRVGIDAMLDEVDDPDDRDEGATARTWISELMDMEHGTNWNIFQKKEGGKNKSTVYGDLLKSFRRIDNESFRENRKKIEGYLENAENLHDLFRRLEKKYTQRLRSLYDDMRQKAEDAKVLFPEVLWNVSGQHTVGKIQAQIKKLLALNMLIDNGNPLEIGNKVIEKAEKEQPDGQWPARLAAYNKALEAYRKWSEALSDPRMKLWLALRVSIPFLGLLKIVTRKREEYLLENNAVELGETSTLLNKIIGEDDTPFVYERMGTYLDHLLIDEFQDTSKMQWENVRPLISETLSRKNDNLIIGDAKQSIYRFRNAEPKLISKDVPEQFYEHIDFGDREMNMNFRSDYNIVQWNNRLFSYTVDALARAVGSRGEDFRKMFVPLYDNVRQEARYKDGGYVRVYLTGKPTPSDEPEDMDEIILPPTEETIRIILDALRRGYHMKDIAVLVRSNDAGDEIVEAIRNYNNTRQDPQPKLEFVSEESLHISNSEAVGQVITVLESIAAGSKPELTTDAKSGRRSGNIHALELSLLLFHREHPELSAAECAELFLDSEPSGQLIEEMLSEMQTLALPALVEAVIAKFVDAPVRRHEAPFLAAFQDCVLEYCEGHPSDLPSFLDWWNRSGRSKSISSPEDVDAVKIMTIHKSKGLEFGVVIIPELLKYKVRLGDYVGGREWIWVSSKDAGLEAFFDGETLPPWLPVLVNESLEGTPLAGKLHEAYNLETMDNLNLAYVAMTRAVHELYVFTPRKPGGNRANQVALGPLLEEFASGEAGVRIVEKNGGAWLEYGKYPERKIIRESGTPADAVTIDIEDYHSTATPDCIRCRETSLPTYSDSSDPDPDDEEDPRSIGNICHAIMENVIVESDLEKAIMRARALGLTGRNSVDTEGRLRVAMIKGGKDVKRWFGGTATRVITERPVLRKGMMLRRPDRIMIFPGDKVEIVDYKFGKIDESGRHSRQVLNYVEYLKSTGMYREVHGWLWYVFEGKVELVR